MGALWDIVQRHIDAQPYGASLRSVAAKLGMSPTALSNWRQPKSLPSPIYLRALADLTGTAYSRVLDAALEDAGYLTRPGDLRDETSMKRAPGSGANKVHALTWPDQGSGRWAARPGEPERRPDETTGEESQDPGDDDPA